MHIDISVKNHQCDYSFTKLYIELRARISYSNCQSRSQKQLAHLTVSPQCRLSRELHASRVALPFNFLFLRAGCSHLLPLFYLFLGSRIYQNGYICMHDNTSSFGSAYTLDEICICIMQPYVTCEKQTQKLNYSS